MDPNLVKRDLVIPNFGINSDHSDYSTPKGVLSQEISLGLRPPNVISDDNSALNSKHSDSEHPPPLNRATPLLKRRGLDLPPFKFSFKENLTPPTPVIGTPNSIDLPTLEPQACGSLYDNPVNTSPKRTHFVDTNFQGKFEHTADQITFQGHTSKFVPNSCGYTTVLSNGENFYATGIAANLTPSTGELSSEENLQFSGSLSFLPERGFTVRLRLDPPSQLRLRGLYAYRLTTYSGITTLEFDPIPDELRTIDYLLETTTCGTCGHDNYLTGGMNICCAKHFVQTYDILDHPALLQQLDSRISNFAVTALHFIPEGQQMHSALKAFNVKYKIRQSSEVRLSKLVSSSLCPLTRSHLDTLQSALDADFVATSPDTGDDSFFRNIINYVKRGFITAFKATPDCIGKVVSSFFEFFMTTLTIFSGLISMLVAKIKTILIKALTSVLDPLVTADKISSGIYDGLIKFIIVFALILFGLTSLFCYTIGTKIAFRVAGVEKVAAEYEATGSESLLPVVLGLVTVAIGGCSKTIAREVTSRIKCILVLVAGGALLSSSLKTLLLLLPSALSLALVRKFGSRAQNADLDLTNWIPNANSLMKVSTIPDVLSSTEYYKRIQETITHYESFVKDLSVERRSLSLAIYAQLLKKSMILHRYHESNVQRPLPYSFHICGVPGVGKSLLLNSLLDQVFDEKDVYYRPIASDFWNGYTNQKVIVYDEFLIGAIQDEFTKTIAREYLSLVSPTPFQPDFASVDDPLVGIKGTYAQPRAVITLNNVAYNTPGGVDADAFQRRRRFVIHVGLANGAHMRDKSNVDMSAYTAEEQRDFAWAAFTVLPALNDPKCYNLNKLTWYTFPEIIEFLKSDLAEHKETSDVLTRSLGLASSMRTPEDILADALKATHHLPGEELGVKDALLTWIDAFFGTDYMATGSRGKKKKGHNIPKYSEPLIIPVPADFVATQPNPKLPDMQRPPTPAPPNGHPTEQILPCFGLPPPLLNTTPPPSVGSPSNTPPPSNVSDVDVGDFFKSPGDEASGVDLPDTEHTLVTMEKLIAFQNAHSTTPLDYLTCLESTKDSHSELSSHSDLYSCESGSDPVPGYPFVSLTHLVSGVDLANGQTHSHLCRGHNHGCRSIVLHSLVGHDTLPWCDRCRDACAPVEGDFAHHPVTCGPDFSPGPTLPRQPDETSSDYLDRLTASVGALSRAAGYRFDAVYTQLLIEHTPVDHKLSFLSRIQNFITEILRGTFKGILHGLTISVIFFIVLHFIRRLNGCEENPIHEDFNATSARPKKTSHERKHQPKFTNLHDYKARGSDFSLVTIEVGLEHSIKFIPLKQRWILGYSHCVLLGQLVDGQAIKIKYRGRTVIETFSEHRCFLDEVNDLMFYEIGSKNQQQFPDNIKKFPTRTELEDFHDASLRYDIDGHTRYGRGIMQTNARYKCKEHRFEPDRSICADATSLAGDCGTPVFATSGPLTGRILGILVAGRADGTPGCIICPVDANTIREVIEPKGSVDITGDFQATSTAEFCATGVSELCALEGPNLDWIEPLERREQIYMPSTTNLRPSVIAELLPWKTNKQPAVLHFSDSRTTNDPLEVCLKNCFSNTQATFDLDILDQVFLDMKQNYDEALIFPVGRRRLTFIEAVSGIDGKLASLKSSTSAGFPKILSTTKPGKRDFFSFDEDGVFQYEPGFRREVEELVRNFDQGVNPPHTWVGYLKDELVSPEKIAEARSRVIYCGDVTGVVAIRMLFGSVLSAVNNSCHTTPMAIGLNQFSHDMECIHSYLTENKATRFIAGDYRGFDQHIQRVVQDRAYDLLFSFSDSYGINQRTRDAVKRHQMDSPAYLGPVRFKPISYHMSGCVFTSAINCLVNEAYFRYIYQVLRPTRAFDLDCRIKVMGDDHILALSPDNTITGPEVQKAMATIGQIYTSDNKQDLIIPDHRPFTDITFLGAHPVLVEGHYSGAIKKSILQQSIAWTTNRNASIVQDVGVMFELASQWPRDFYLDYRQTVTDALLNTHNYVPTVLPWASLRRLVAGRTALTGEQFPTFIATGDTGDGLVTLVTSTDKGNVSSTSSPPEATAENFNVGDMNLDYGTEGSMYRTTLDWSESQITGTRIAEYSVPWELLGLGDGRNLQNMPFDRFVYWRGDVELTFQINGTPFQQGALIAYFNPLVPKDDISIMLASTAQSVILQPNRNTTGILRVPYNHPRGYLATGFQEPSSSLGKVVIRVLSPLLDPNSQDVSISIYTRFPNSKFKLPKPVHFVATGQGASRTVTTNNFGKIVGDLSLEGPHINEQVANTEVVVPLDNPIVGGCSVPVLSKFSSLSKSEGLEPTTVLALRPNELSRQHTQAVMNPDTNIAHLCAKRSYLTRLSWSENDHIGKTLYSCPLNSVLTNMHSNEQIKLPLCLGIVNLFQFWHFDIVFEFMCVRTAYHSGRLKAVVAYGSDRVGTDDNIYYQNVLDYNGEQDTHKVVVRYNQGLEWMKSYSGVGPQDYNLDYSLGTLELRVVNRLRHPTTVSTYNEILVFVSLENVRVAVPHPTSFVSFAEEVGEGSTMPVSWSPHVEEHNHTLGDAFKATGFETIVPDESAIEGAETVGGTAITMRTNEVDPALPCEERPDGKFPHEIADLQELMRRRVYYPIANLTNNSFGTGLTITTSSSEQGTRAQVVLGLPMRWFTLYRLWAGSFRLRIFVNDAKNVKVTYQPVATDDGIHGSGTFSFIENLGSTTKFPLDTGAFASAKRIVGIPNFPASEVAYPLGHTDWIDVTVPFYTNKERLTTRFGERLGTVHITTPTPDAYMTLWIGHGDDFRYSVFGPPAEINFGLNTGLVHWFAKGTSFLGWHDT